VPFVRVDLYTDAGVKDRVATWGAVCAPPGRGHVERSGRMRDNLADTTAAELRAMANGLHAMIRAGVIERGDEVVIRCDNFRAVDVVNGAHVPPKTRERHGIAVRKLKAMAIEAGIVLIAKRVNGHQPITSEDPHAPFNRRADALCRAAREGAQPKPRKIMVAPPKVSAARKALAVARKLEGRA